MECAVQGAVGMKTVSIARQFSITPGGRTQRDGDDNGQRFRDMFLEPAVVQGQAVLINLDGVAGLPGSFCDQAFGNLIRDHHLTRTAFDSLFHFEGHGSDYPINLGMIELNITSAFKEAEPG